MKLPDRRRNCRSFQGRDGSPSRSLEWIGSAAPPKPEKQGTGSESRPYPGTSAAGAAWTRCFRLALSCGHVLGRGSAGHVLRAPPVRTRPATHGQLQSSRTATASPCARGCATAITPESRSQSSTSPPAFFRGRSLPRTNVSTRTAAWTPGHFLRAMAGQSRLAARRRTPFRRIDDLGATHQTGATAPTHVVVQGVLEAVQAWRLEEVWSKDRILAAYLNCLDYGNLNFGCAEAAHAYFHKPLGDLSVAEAAFLASPAAIPYPAQSLPSSGAGRSTPTLGARSGWQPKAISVRTSADAPAPNHCDYRPNGGLSRPRILSIGHSLIAAATSQRQRTKAGKFAPRSTSG